MAAILVLLTIIAFVLIDMAQTRRSQSSENAFHGSDTSNDKSF